MPRLRRAYIEGPYGQVHLIEAAAPDSALPPLVCLHATAYSARSLVPLVEEFGGDRRVLALDTPGYGGSDAPAAPIEIEGYADSLIDTLQSLSPDRPVDLFGHHTGIAIAVEAAFRRPGLIRRMAMIGVPFFDAEERPSWERRLLVHHSLEAGLDQFAERWNYLVAHRPQGMSLERAFTNFVDELRAWPHGWWAHAALFRYDMAARLPTLDIPVLVINPDSPLAAPSRAAVALLRAATLMETPEMTGATFERHAPRIVSLIRDFLDG